MSSQPRGEFTYKSEIYSPLTVAEATLGNQKTESLGSEDGECRSPKLLVDSGSHAIPDCLTPAKQELKLEEPLLSRWLEDSTAKPMREEATVESGEAW